MAKIKDQDLRLSNLSLVPLSLFPSSNWEAVGCNYVFKESVLTALAKKSTK